MSVVTVGLVSPKHHHNVGSVLRAATGFGAHGVFYTGRRYKQSPADTCGSWNQLPVVRADDLRDVIPYRCVPVLVELLPEAESLVEYRHPESAFYVFGPEDGTVGKEVRNWCRDVVYVPTKHCLNLAATVNVVLYDRFAKANFVE